MEIVLSVVVLASAAGVAIALWTRRGLDPQHEPPERRDSALHGARAASDAEVEQRDVDDMITAIDEYRRRRGGRDVGEELSDELRRGDWERET